MLSPACAIIPPVELGLVPLHLQKRGWSGMSEISRELEAGGRQTGRAGERIVRVLRMQWLMQHHEVTVDRLASTFGVSRRTVFRDLQTIGAARLPLAIRRTCNGFRLIRIAAETSMPWEDGQLDLS